ncbi:DUF6368 family protein [Kitasatospora sp. NPDC005748]|uniref:DUF6368 family protein n=1 Tax=Kitasatospora sp. NPDC005748 TaxID=3157063 RepID=UPI0033C98AC0
MAGPAVGLWLFEPCEAEDVVAGVRPWLEGFCEPVEAGAGGGLDFWVRDGSALGVPAFDPASVGVFFLTEDEEVPAEDEDYALFPRPPVRGLVLGAGCSGPVIQLVLGRLALVLAECLGALVDFDGLLGVGATPGEGERAAGQDALLARARALKAALPGRLEEVWYDMWGGGRWVRHVGDAEFLAAWLAHPDYHLVT